MFDLESAIGNWRRQLAADGVIDAASLDELESHLRDAIEAKMRAGAGAELAFYKAMVELGENAQLKSEFKAGQPYRLKRAQVVQIVALLLMAQGIVIANFFSSSNVQKICGFLGALGLFVIFLGKYLAFVRWKNGEPDFSNFSASALQAVELARAEAPKLHHDFIGTEHLLLGICGEIPELLAGLGLQRERIREEIEKLVDSTPVHEMNSSLPFTPRAKHAMELAAAEAKRLGHARTESEHLFLGLLLEPDGVARRVLHGLGVDFESARKKVIEMVRG